MARAIALQPDFSASELRRLARRSTDAAQARRLLALAAIYDGGTRSEAARLPASHPAAAGRLPLRPAGDHPTTHTFISASLPAAQRHLAPGGGLPRAAIAQREYAADRASSDQTESFDRIKMLVIQ